MPLESFSHCEQRLPDWPVTGATVAAVVNRLNVDGIVQQFEHAAWILQVYPRTVRRWSSPTTSRSSIPYASWCLLCVASRQLQDSALDTLIPGNPVYADPPEPRCAMQSSLTRRQLMVAARAVARRERWRPTTELAASVVMPFGPRVAERGVRQVADALHVDQSTVWRWVDSSRRVSAIPFSAWSLLLLRENLLEPGFPVCRNKKVPLRNESDSKVGAVIR